MRASRPLALVFGIAVIVALCGLRATDPFAVHAVRELGFDQLQRLKPRPVSDAPVRVVDIDEAALAAYGQWPWPRDRLARLAERLEELGAAVVVFDIAFAEPDRLSPSSLAAQLDLKAALGDAAGRLAGLRDNDKVFAAALSATRAVLGFGITDGSGGALPVLKSGFAVTGTRTLDALPGFAKVTPVVPALAAAAQGLGSMSLTPGSSSGVVRNLPLMLRQTDRPFPALVLEALRVAQGASTFIIRGAADQPAIIEDIRVGAFTVPVTRQGEMWLYYRPDDPGLYVPVGQVLEGSDDAGLAARLAGHIVFVGTSAVGLLDARITALGETVPGVSIHAQAAEQIIAGAFLARPDWLDGAELLTTAATGLVVVASTLFFGPLVAMAFGGLAAAAMVAGVWLAFTRAGLLVDLSFPVFTVFTAAFVMTAYRFLVADRETRFVRRAFSHYVSPSVLAQIQHDPGRLKLGGDVREMTVMFADVRGFTPISEKLAPEELVVFLNRLLGQLSGRVTAHDGTIDKYIGDAVMAFWNAPVAIAGHEKKACLAALDMRRVLAALNAADAFGFAAKGLDAARIGIGLNAGRAVVGNLGSAERFDYSCLGDTVNVAARVESACKEVGFDIVVTASVAVAVPDLALLDAGAIALKGKSAPEPIYILVGDADLAAGDGYRVLKQRHDRLFAGPDGLTAAEWQALAEQGEALIPGLARFYQALARRRGDHALPA